MSDRFERTSSVAAARDRAIFSLALRQGWHVTRDQLRELGLTREAIRHRNRRGLLVEIYHGVYAVGHPATSPLDRAHGALLAIGPRSVLSHSSAGTLLGIHSRWRFPLEVTTSSEHRPGGLIVHHSRLLTPADVITVNGLRATSPARTLLDNAPRLAPRRRVRALNELRLNHHLELADVATLLERFPRHPGAKLVRPLIDQAPAAATRSAYEDEWPPFAVRHHLPRYEMNQVVAGHRVDVLFPPNLLIVELDGWLTHATAPSFESDRAQDAEILARTGIPTIRITYRQFHHSPVGQARRIQAIIAARRASAA